MSPLVILLPRKGYLQHIGPKIAKIVRCYCHNLGQSEKNIFDFSLCEKWLNLKPSIFLSPNSLVSDQATFSSLLQSYTVQGPPVSVVGPIICPRSHSTKAISNAKIKTVKLTVVVVAGYLICSAPYICIQLYVVLAQKPDMGLCKLAKVMKDILRVSIPTAVGFLGADSTECVIFLQIAGKTL